MLGVESSHYHPLTIAVMAVLCTLKSASGSLLGSAIVKIEIFKGSSIVARPCDLTRSTGQSFGIYAL